jgi:hypothetical protein
MESMWILVQEGRVPRCQIGEYCTGREATQKAADYILNKQENQEEELDLAA